MMPINHIGLAFISLLFTTCLRAQNPNLDFKNSVLAYNLSTFEIEHANWTSVKETLNKPFSTTQVQLIHPVVAYRWRTKKVNFQEVELTRLAINSTDIKMEGDYVSESFIMFTGNQVVTTDVQARYEFIFTFNKNKETRWVPAIGFGAKSFYKRSDVTYHEPENFSRSTQNIGIEGQVVPRLTYFFRKRMFFDLNMPVSLFYQDYVIYKTDNPAIPHQYRRIGDFNFRIMPVVFSLRLGLGIKF